MKKFACLVLALAMVFSLSISASALTKNFDSRSGKTDYVPGPPWTATHEVGVTITGSEELPVYYVVVTWGDLVFTYSNGTGQQWNPESHSYDDATGAGWENNGVLEDVITVANHSNKGVTVSASRTLYDADGNNRGKDFTVEVSDGESASLDRATAGSDFNDAPHVTYDVALTNTDAPSNKTAGQFNLGQVIINIAAA